MPKEIIINVSGEQSHIAIVEDGDLVELYVENPDNARTLGDIYLGRVRRILPGIKAAFVDIGQKQDAFLHFSDLSDNLPELLELSKGNVPDRSLKLSEAVSEEAEDEEPQAKGGRRDADRKRGGRGRNQRRSESAGEAEAAETAEPAAESGEEKRGRRGRGRQDDASEPSGRRRGRGRGSKQETSEPEAPATARAPSILPPDGDAEQEEPASAEGEGDRQEEQAGAAEEPQGRKRRRSRRGGRRRGRGGRSSSGQQDRKDDAEPRASADDGSASSAEAKEGGEAPKPRRGRSRGGRQQPKSEPRGSAGGDGESGSKPEPTPEPKPATEDSNRLATSSRFVIDLTAKSGRVEEEEEEEPSKQKRSSRRRSSRGGRSRRGGSRGGGNRRGGGGGRGRSSGGSSGRKNTSSNDADDEGPKKPERPLEEYLRSDQRILVKVTKEPISTKGSRVSTDVSLAGRFLVLIPAADYVAVSKKIESQKERRRLKSLAKSLLPEGLGLIVRTVAEGRDAKALDADLRLLLQRWDKIERQLRQKPEPPKRLFEDVNMVSSIVRDLFSEDYDRIVIDDESVYRNVKGYVQAVAPQMADVVKLHKGRDPIFRKYKVERDVRAAFEKRVALPGGGYLFIETTEAMHVVDVNSGRAGRKLSQEENALRVNLEAAREIAKQLRLRDLGGIICVDFIDMRSEGFRRKVYDALKKEFRRDRAVTKLLPMSDFGVVQITRQRLRPSITTTLDIEDLGPPPPDEPEPEEPQRRDDSGEDSSQPQPSASEVVAHLERWLATYRAEVQDKHRKRPVLLRVHPFLAAFLHRGVPSQFTKWKFRTRLRLVLDVDDGTDPLAFRVLDQKSGKNLTKKYDPDRRAETAEAA